MKTYEYTIALVPGGFHSAIAVRDELNNFGKEGWEFCALMPGKDFNDLVCLLKREKVE